ncbi:alkaline phosphatase family protein [Pseudarthrobacter sp. NIBRBAC000502770]|uniref:alkaline phosphatase family protein n=1 Tax=Pseudarthrobacter sp. NIBRBAC000502770 TaxID=2590785 RepID=UPI001140611D|nr:alkaline phosphatase family protein [Pseudarthrobacter sp. NIBRBAC000502770]QDG88122.1 hypothetical protein NIBR502770_06245 [Pseudarthrobacter sp. NIBRBAC000502770]
MQPTVPAPTAQTQSREATATPSPSPSPTLTPQPANGMCGAPGPAPAQYQHIIWITFENLTLQHAQQKMPYFNGTVVKNCGLATNFTTELHPSLPNYIAMTSGSTQGITGDSSGMLSADNIYNQVKQSGRQWRNYAFGMPFNCDHNDSANKIYTAHHEAVNYYSNIAEDCAQWDVPVGSQNVVTDTTDVTNSPLATALDTDTLPAFATLGPTDDGGCSSCGGEVDPGPGDLFLQRWLPKITNSAAYKAGTVLVYVTWDEPEDFTTVPSPQVVATAVIAPTIPAGTTSDTAFNHYSMLRDTEDVLGITNHLGNAATAPSMRSAFGY